MIRVLEAPLDLLIALQLPAEDVEKLYFQLVTVGAGIHPLVDDLHFVQLVRQAVVINQAHVLHAHDIRSAAPAEIGGRKPDHALLGAAADFQSGPSAVIHRRNGNGISHAGGGKGPGRAAGTAQVAGNTEGIAQLQTVIGLCSCGPDIENIFAIHLQIGGGGSLDRIDMLGSCQGNDPIRFPGFFHGDRQVHPAESTLIFGLRVEIRRVSVKFVAFPVSAFVAVGPAGDQVFVALVHVPVSILVVVQRSQIGRGVDLRGGLGNIHPGQPGLSAAPIGLKSSNAVNAVVTVDGNHRIRVFNGIAGNGDQAVFVNGNAIGIAHYFPHHIVRTDVNVVGVAHFRVEFDGAVVGGPVSVGFQNGHAGVVVGGHDNPGRRTGIRYRQVFGANDGLGARGGALHGGLVIHVYRLRALPGQHRVGGFEELGVGIGRAGRRYPETGLFFAAFVGIGLVGALPDNIYIVHLVAVLIVTRTDQDGTAVALYRRVQDLCPLQLRGLLIQGDFQRACSRRFHAALDRNGQLLAGGRRGNG